MRLRTLSRTGQYDRTYEAVPGKREALDLGLPAPSYQITTNLPTVLTSVSVNRACFVAGEGFRLPITLEIKEEAGERWVIATLQYEEEPVTLKTSAHAGGHLLRAVLYLVLRKQFGTGAIRVY